MRLIGPLLTLILALALARLVIVGLVLALLLILLWAAIRHPREAAGVIVLTVIGTAAEAYPAITLCLLATMTGAFLLGKIRVNPPR